MVLVAIGAGIIGYISTPGWLALVALTIGLGGAVLVAKS